jgi:hypothetical protein
VVQSEDTVREKDSLTTRACVSHGLVVLICLGLALHSYGFLGLALSTVIAAVHVLVDWLKSLLSRNLGARQRLLVFFADQFVHLATIAVAWEVTQLIPSQEIVHFYSVYFAPKTLSVLRSVTGLTLNGILAIASAYVFAVFGGAVLVRMVLDGFELLRDPGIDTKNGRYIGMLERMLMVTLVVANALPSIAFVIAAKALARFQQLSEFRFAEYYLIGTLSSTLIAITAGVALKAVLQAP